MNIRVTLAATTLALTLTHASSALAQYVVQIPVDALLNGRSVSTLTAGVVVPWTANEGVYNNGGGGAYATAAVKAQLAATAGGVGLPDDGLFPATGMLPPFQLNFSNAAPASSPQTYHIYANAAAPSFQFAVPPATYSALYLIFTCSEGSASFTVTLSYAGGVANDVAPFTIPDTGIGVQTTGSPHFYLITNTGKWDTNDNDVEPTGHTIEGIQLTPSSQGMLTGVQVTRTSTNYLLFWGATGIATTPVDAGTAVPLDSGLAGSGFDDSGAGASSGASTGASSGAASGTIGSSGTSSGATATSGGTSAGTSSGEASGAGGGTAGSSATGAVGSGTTTSTGASGAMSQSGSITGTAGSNGTPSSASSSSGCSFAPTSGTSGGWTSLAVVGLVLRARRRRGRKSAVTSISSS
jgi:MYXO-CTERM domain-containing protein